MIFFNETWQVQSELGPGFDGTRTLPREFGRKKRGEFETSQLFRMRDFLSTPTVC